MKGEFVGGGGAFTYRCIIGNLSQSYNNSFVEGTTLTTPNNMLFIPYASLDGDFFFFASEFPSFLSAFCHFILNASRYLIVGLQKCKIVDM